MSMAGRTSETAGVIQINSRKQELHENGSLTPQQLNPEFQTLYIYIHYIPTPTHISPKQSIKYTAFFIEIFSKENITQSKIQSTF